jgi:hypothetical protein
MNSGAFINISLFTKSFIMNGSIGMGFNPFLKWKLGLALAEFTYWAKAG